MEADRANAGAMSRLDVEWGVTDLGGLPRLHARPAERPPDQLDPVLGLAAERALSWREVASEAEPVHPQARHALGVPGQESKPHAAALELRKRPGSLGRGAPVRGVVQQICVAPLETPAPTLIRVAAQELPRDPERRLTTVVEPVDGIVWQRGIQGIQKRPTCHRVRCQEQGPVDVEQRQARNSSSLPSEPLGARAGF